MSARAERKWRSRGLNPSTVVAVAAVRPAEELHLHIDGCDLPQNDGWGMPRYLAEWAGHSVHVLLKVYAKCIDGQDEAARRRIAGALEVKENEA